MNMIEGTMESIEKLREYAEQCCPEYEDYDSRMMKIADAIEAEIAERYMELPVDADGVPWHIGDAIKDHGKLHRMSLDKYGWAFEGSTAIDPRLHRHVNPRTIEDVLKAFFHDALDADTFCTVRLDDVLAKYADEIRELMEVGE